MSIDWQRELRSHSPPAEVELISFSSPATRQPPTAMQADEDEPCGGAERFADDFKDLSDHQLQGKIKRCRLSDANPSDGGEKLRKFVHLMEMELDRRRSAGSRKGYMSRRQVAQSPIEDDPYAFNDYDKPNTESISGKCHLKPCFTTHIKICNKGEEAASPKELNCFNTGKLVDRKKAEPRAINPANCEQINQRVHQNIIGHKRVNMDCNITDKRTEKICITSQQKNNSSNHMSKKLHVEDDNFWGSIASGDRCTNQTYESQKPSYFVKRTEKKEVVCLDDEDTRPAKSVDAETGNKGDMSKIYYPSRTDLETVELTYLDIKCVEPEEYLKSPVINFYIQYLKKSRPHDDLYIFNTYFYSKLEEALSTRTRDKRDLRFSKLRRWWRSVDIFKTPYIILPIHGQMHWSLIIICMPAKETTSGPIILHLDSLGLHSSDEVLNLIGSYLIAEWRHLQNDPSYNIPFSERIWRCLSRKIEKQKVEVPRQKNDYDCGIFMLYYIDRFIQDAPERLPRDGVCMFGRKWFNPEEASGQRERIRALLFDVFHNAPPTDGDSQSESGSHSDSHSKGENMDDGATIVTVVS